MTIATTLATNLIVDRHIEPAILDVVREAREVAVLVSPVIKVWDGLQKEIREAAERGVKVVVACNRDADRPDLAKLAEDGATVRIVKNLHAKVALNESTAIVTSMDLHSYLESHTREVAIRLVAPNDIDELRHYVVWSLLNSGETYPSHSQQPEPARTRACSDCGVTIPYQAYRPRCARCQDAAVASKRREPVEVKASPRKRVA